GTIQAAFGFSSPAGCAPTNIAFTNQSVGTNNSYLWRFGDGTTSTQNNPLHQYALAGTYTITLIVTDTVSCNKIDSISKTIT
ncbi:PKD domain-containing protein, partial [Klebsiella michiganensis]|uniref:PKD domain-containing protein n=1 Tax=Klebsiella michiganensis TaxID=1134687 RepID=UPI0013D81723